MQIEDLQQLEAKIAGVLEKMETLKQENGDLQRRLDDLQSRYDDKAARLEEVSLELEKARSNARDFEKEEKIRTKVSSLLEKLDSF